MTERLGSYDLNTIVTGDARELARDVPDESVDLIFTDPVYDRIDDYRWLAETANRVLRPGGALLTFYGIGYTEETYRALRLGGREVTWNCPVYQPGQTQRIHPKTFNHWYGLLWAGGQPLRTFVDVQTSYMSTLNGSHKWRKNPAPLFKYLQAFANPDDVVADFFAGEGTIPAICKQYGCDYLAFEIDPDTADLARRRVAETQPPLPLQPQPTQGELL